MTVPTLTQLAAERASAAQDALDSDLSALRTMRRHLAILADDYANDDAEVDACLSLAGSWIERSIAILTKRRKKEERPQ